MKKKVSAFLAFLMTTVMVCGAACNTGTTTSSSSDGKESSVSSNVGGNESTGDKESSNGGENTEFSAPNITIANPAMELYPSDALDYEDNWDFDVTVSDEYGEVDIDIDWGGFDQSEPVAGVYTITYTATNEKGVSASATRTITIKEALAQIVLKVQKHQNSNGPVTTTLAFEGQYYYELTEAPTEAYAAKSCVIKNASGSAMTVSVNGKYGCAAIIDANGLVVEGRDGANQKLVNEAHPLRASGASLDGTKFAENMEIPAGGYAIVVQAYYAGDNANNDGRNFLNYNAIYQYHTPVELYSTDTEVGTLTSYVDQGPVVKAVAAVSVYVGTSESDAKAAAIAGVEYSDDNGTFDVADDVSTGLTISVIDTDGYDGSKTGSYTFTLKVEDGKGNATEFTRVVNVNQDLFTISYTYSNGTSKSMSVDEKTEICIVDGKTACPSTFGSYEFIVFTSDYTGTLNFDISYGAAIILDSNGKVKSIYDAANGAIYTSTTFTERTLGLSTADFDKIAFNAWSEDLSDGEYLIFANQNATNSHAARAFLLNARWSVYNGATNDTYVEIGMQFTLEGKNSGKLVG